MTATDQMRAMLDQLMGTSRNGKYTDWVRAASPRHFAFAALAI